MFSGKCTAERPFPDSIRNDGQTRGVARDRVYSGLGASPRRRQTFSLSSESTRMSDETRMRVLHAAGPIFAERGFEAATVRDICEAAGVNVASVNYHFGDKRQLYNETVQHARNLRTEQVPWRDLPPDADAQTQLFAFVHTMLSRMLGVNAQPWQTSLMMRELIDPTEDCRAMVEDFFRPRLDRLLEILEPVFPPDQPRHQRYQVAFSVIGQCLFYRVGNQMVEIVVPKSDRRRHYGLDTLAHHIAGFTLAALGTPYDPDRVTRALSPHEENHEATRT